MGLRRGAYSPYKSTALSAGAIFLLLLIGCTRACRLATSMAHGGLPSRCLRAESGGRAVCQRDQYGATGRAVRLSGTSPNSPLVSNASTGHIRAAAAAAVVPQLTSYGGHALPRSAVGSDSRLCGSAALSHVPAVFFQSRLPLWPRALLFYTRPLLAAAAPQGDISERSREGGVLGNARLTRPRKVRLAPL